MNKIVNITDDPLQTQTIILPNGNVFTYAMYYIPNQYGWFFNNITYGSFVLNSLRITNNANMLYQWQNLLPFGIACFSVSKREPTQQQDFLSGASSLYVLTQAECQAYAAYIRGGALPA